jgi:hypothetical protein
MKTIRVTLNIETPYDSELLNYKYMLDNRIKDIVKYGELCYQVTSGDLSPTSDPITRDPIYNNNNNN